MKRILASLIIGLSFSLGGCAPTGTVTEKAPVTKDLSAYHTASITVQVSGKTEKPDNHKSQLQLAVEKHLKEKNLFSQIVPESGELDIRVNIDKIEEGVEVLGARGDTDVGSTVQLFDTKEGKAIGEFSATGTSKRSSSTSINGTNTSNFSAKEAMAHDAMAIQIADYIASHRAGGGK